MSRTLRNIGSTSRNFMSGVLNGGSEKTQKVVFVFVHGHVV